MAPLTPMASTPISRAGSGPKPTELAAAFASYKMGDSLVEVAVTDESPFMDDAEELEKLEDMAVRILPGVRKMIDSLPTGKYAVATSGAKTYCHGCLTRTGLVPFRL
jgi:hypothetical protein